MEKKITYRVLCLTIILLLCDFKSEAHVSDSLLVMFWNVENFFDWTDQKAGDSDSDFSSDGSRRWTMKRFYRKCDAIAKTIMWIGDTYGRMPDVIGLSEIENRGVLVKLLHSTLLRKYDYNIVHRDSPDRRGIDVALLYRSGSFELLSKSFKVPSVDSIALSTREILHTEFRCRNGKKLDFIVNHHPSKYGGNKESAGRRMAAASALKDICDSLETHGRGEGIIAMGDFNDDPDSEALENLPRFMTNLGEKLKRTGEGTIRYEGKWEMIDFFIVSRQINSSSMSIAKVPFLMVEDRKYGGKKPFRTYSGPRYIGGVSDHCPILLWVDVA